MNNIKNDMTRTVVDPTRYRLEVETPDPILPPQGLCVFSTNERLLALTNDMDSLLRTRIEEASGMKLEHFNRNPKRWDRFTPYALHRACRCAACSAGIIPVEFTGGGGIEDNSTIVRDAVERACALSQALMDLYWVHCDSTLNPETVHHLGWSLIYLDLVNSLEDWWKFQTTFISLSCLIRKPVISPSARPGFLFPAS
jgi:hypothetical protein